MTLNFLLLAIGACNAYFRYASGILFCFIGLAYLFSIYQTYQHRMKDGHFSALCELNLNVSYHEGGSDLMAEFDNIPRTFAEDSNLLMALLIY